MQGDSQAERLVEALLTLARSDRGTGPRSVLDLAVLAEDALDAAMPAIKSVSLRVTTLSRPRDGRPRCSSNGWYVTHRQRGNIPGAAG